MFDAMRLIVTALVATPFSYLLVETQAANNLALGPAIINLLCLLFFEFSYTPQKNGRKMCITVVTVT